MDYEISAHQPDSTDDVKTLIISPLPDNPDIIHPLPHTSDEKAPEDGANYNTDPASNEIGSDLENSNEGDADLGGDLGGDPEAEGENYGMAKIRAVMDACRDDPEMKPSLSYIALISLAIDNTDRKRMLLSEIYAWIAEKFPYYKSRDRSWRNSIRHNLSLNECFIKAGRSENGKGNYWTVHPANVEDFSQGDFRRRRARRRVRKCNEEMERLQLGYSAVDAISSDPYFTPGCNGYVMMTNTQAPAQSLIRLFGADTILSREEQVQAGFHGQCDVTAVTNGELYPPTLPAVPHHTGVMPMTSQPLYCPQPSTSGYASSQFGIPEMDSRYPALASATDNYRFLDQTNNGFQYLPQLKSLTTTTVSCRYNPY